MSKELWCNIYDELEEETGLEYGDPELARLTEERYADHYATIADGLRLAAKESDQ